LLGRRFPRWDRRLRGFAVGAVAVAGLISAPLALHTTYGPPRFVESADLPALSGGPVTYADTIRLLGVHQPDRTLRGGHHDHDHELTLCWEVLRPAARPAAFSIKLAHDGVIVADRTSILGLGRYPSADWRPGERFCDDVVVLLRDPDHPDAPRPAPATVYDVWVVLLDAETLAVDWPATAAAGQPLDVPVVAQVISPAADLVVDQAELISTAIRWPGFADLDGFALAGRANPGAALTLDLRWAVTARTPDDWSLFVHLTHQPPHGEPDTVVVSDGTPRAGAYPTWAWSPGEQINDRLPLDLPPDVPPGEYTLTVGFYRPDTGERMPVTLDGTAIPARAAPLTQVTIRDELADQSRSAPR
ncbi:MAG: hypothetical protein GYB67_01090, partial [Chloroflexi bacterium]|nr:hypothetical protein [Chloroflexota bacterium]